MKHSTTTDGTPVITLTNTEWDDLRARNAARDPEEAARERAARQAQWVADRKAYEAAQAAKAQAQPVRRTKADRRNARANRQQLRTILRRRTAATRATQRAHRAVATGQPLPVRTRLVAAGLDDATAKRFAGAFSRGLVADDVRETKIKLKARVRKTVQVKLFTASTFAARLAVYRPKDATVAARFERIALVVAA